MELLLLRCGVHAFGQSRQSGKCHLVIVEIELLGDVGNRNARQFVVVDIDIGELLGGNHEIAFDLVVSDIKPLHCRHSSGIDGFKLVIAGIEGSQLVVSSSQLDLFDLIVLNVKTLELGVLGDVEAG